MDPKTTAVVLIEYQNDFTSEGGTLHGAVKPVMDQTNMLANTVETVKQARAAGAMIVHAPITFAEDYREISPEPYGILKGVVDSQSFQLLEARSVRCVKWVASVNGSRRYNANGRLMLLHGPDLHRRSMAAQQQAWRQVKRVVHIR